MRRKPIPTLETPGLAVADPLRNKKKGRGTVRCSNASNRGKSSDSRKKKKTKAASEKKAKSTRYM